MLDAAQELALRTPIFYLLFHANVLAGFNNPNLHLAGLRVGEARALSGFLKELLLAPENKSRWAHAVLARELPPSHPANRPSQTRDKVRAPRSENKNFSKTSAECRRKGDDAETANIYDQFRVELAKLRDQIPNAQTATAESLAWTHVRDRETWNSDATVFREDIDRRRQKMASAWLEPVSNKECKDYRANEVDDLFYAQHHPFWYDMDNAVQRAEELNMRAYHEKLTKGRALMKKREEEKAKHDERERAKSKSRGAKSKSP